MPADKFTFDHPLVKKFEQDLIDGINSKKSIDDNPRIVIFVEMDPSREEEFWEVIDALIYDDCHQVELYNSEKLENGVIFNYDMIMEDYF